MARREEEARKAEERIAAVRAAEDAKKTAEALKDGYKATLGPRLKDWSEVRVCCVCLEHRVFPLRFPLPFANVFLYFCSVFSHLYGVFHHAHNCV